MSYSSLTVKHGLAYSANAPRAQTYNLERVVAVVLFSKSGNFQSDPTTDKWPNLDSHRGLLIPRPMFLFLLFTVSR